MKKFSRLAAPLILLASFGVPLLASAAGNIPRGGDCTSNSDGCISGLFCVPGDFASICSSSSSGDVAPAVPSSVGGGVNLTIAKGYSEGIINFINQILVPVLMAIAFIVFLWGVFKYFIYEADNETERAKGKQFVLWGIIGFVVILSVWGLVNLVSGTLGLQLGGKAPTPPTF